MSIRSLSFREDEEFNLLVSIDDSIVSVVVNNAKGTGSFARSWQKVTCHTKTALAVTNSSTFVGHRVGSLVIVTVARLRPAATAAGGLQGPS